LETDMNDWLEDKLRHEDRYLDDAGFTARVVAALPVRRQRRWLRPAIIGTASLAGLVIALWMLPSENYIARSFVQLLAARSLSAVPLLPVAVIGLIFWAMLSVAANEN
jgi:hypothetical protein